MEFPQLLSEVDKMERFVVDNGIKFTRLKSPVSFEYLLSERKNNWTDKTKPLLVELDPRGHGWATHSIRWCTRELKTDIISRYLSEIKKEYKVINIIGIAADERKRLERSVHKKSTNRYPLNEWGWTEAMCLKYCYDNGINWGGLYEHFNRVSCWCCPLQSLQDLREMYHNFPELWEELERLDKTQWRVYKGYDTVETLRMRFEYEDYCLEHGVPIDNRQFYQKLHSIIPYPAYSDTTIRKDYYESHTNS